MKIIFRVFALLVIAGLLVSGGFMAYQAGVAQGISQAPALASAIEKAAENGQVAPIPPMYGYGHPYGYGFPRHFGFFPIGGICLSIFFLFLAFAFLKMAFFRRWRHHHGHWGRHWEGEAPSMFDEWHKRAHGEKSADDAGGKA